MHTQCEPGPFSSSSKGLGTRLITNCIPSQELKSQGKHTGEKEREREQGREIRKRETGRGRERGGHKLEKQRPKYNKFRAD